MAATTLAPSPALPALSLDKLPADVLSRVLHSPAELLALAGVNRALRASLDAPQHASLWPLWAAVVLRRADPAASLALAARGARAPPDEADAAAWLSEEEVAASRVSDMYKARFTVQRQEFYSVSHCPYEAAAQYDVRRTAGEFKRADARVTAGAGADDEVAADAAAASSPGAPAGMPAWVTALAWHAARLCSWRALVRQLTQRECVTCGAVTRWVAWAPDADSDAGGHPVGDDTPASPAHADVPAAAADRVASTLGRCCAGCRLPGAAPDAALSRAVVLNAPFFDAAPPVAELDGDALGDGALKALQAALQSCPEGGSIALRGTLKLWEPLVIAGCAAVRLLGVPPPTNQFRPMHWQLVPGADGKLPATYPQSAPARASLWRLEKAAAADIGCPLARLQVDGRYGSIIDVSVPLWLDALHIGSGNHGEYGKLGWPHDVGDIMGSGASGPALEVLGGDAATSPLVLKQCWLTAYSGSGLVLDAGAHGALLRCCVSNCLGAAVACNAGATLRMRGCHVVFNNADVAGGTRADVAALAAANTFAYNWPTPGTIDVFPFPPERTHYVPCNLRLPPEEELAPWSPQFTVPLVHCSGNDAQRTALDDAQEAPVRFPRTDDVALLTG